MLTPYSFFDDFWNPRRSSVYVISDSQMSAWKRSQAEAEIIELDKLIQAHEQSIERLKTTRDQLRADYPVGEPTEDTNSDKSTTSSV